MSNLNGFKKSSIVAVASLSLIFGLCACGDSLEQQGQMRGDAINSYIQQGDDAMAHASNPREVMKAYVSTVCDAENQYGADSVVTRLVEQDLSVKVYDVIRERFDNENSGLTGIQRQYDHGATSMCRVLMLNF